MSNLSAVTTTATVQAENSIIFVALIIPLVLAILAIIAIIITVIAVLIWVRRKYKNSQECVQHTLSLRNGDEQVEIHQSIRYTNTFSTDCVCASI